MYRYYNNPNELYHFGRKGMKWGQRLYQNKDGSLTALGKIRYGSKENYERRTGKSSEVKKTSNSSDTNDSMPKKKKLSEMSDKEISDLANRIRNENFIRENTPKVESKAKKYAEEAKKLAWDEVLKPAVKEAGAAYVRKQLAKTLDLEKKPTKQERAQKEADYYRNLKSIQENKEYLSGKAIQRRELAAESKHRADLMRDRSNEATFAKMYDTKLKELNDLDRDRNSNVDAGLKFVDDWLKSLG